MSRTPLSPTLATIPVDQLLEEFEAFDAAHRVTPNGYGATLTRTWNQITRAAASRGLGETGALLTELTDVLVDLTGEKNLSQYPPLAVRDQLHLYRNTTITVILAAAAMIGADTRPVLAGAPTLKQRTQSRDRPLTHDEITVLRVLAATRVAAKSSSQAATVFALCDAGQTPTETTQVTVNDIDDRIQCPLVQTAGHRRGLSARLLPLDAFHTAILAERMSQDPRRRPSDTLSYAPRTNAPGSDAAAASASGIVSRFMAEAKIANIDVAPCSIRAWRIRHAWDTQGPDAAMQISGRDLGATVRIAAVPLEFDAPDEPVEEI